MKKLFGTDGIRGEAGKFPLDEETVSIIGSSLTRHFAEKLGKNPRFIVGQDTRESGLWIEKAFCKGAVNEGAVCESAKVITTPGVAYLTSKLAFDAGIVISASHNPFEDNGIKIFLPSGKKIDKEIENFIEKDIYNKAKSQNNFAEINGNSANASELQQHYLKFLLSEFKDLTLEGFKMVIDCANGAASHFAPQLFNKIGAETVIINNSPDGKNINRDCGSLHIENLQKKVLEEKADFGVAFDGDADRSLFVDEKGEFVDGDTVLWIMGQHLQEHGQLNNDLVVATVMSNIGLEIAFNKKNIKLLRTPVGDKYVLAELLNSNASIGGEQSGHIIFPSKSLVGDGIYTTLYLLEALNTHKKTLSEITEGFTKFPQILLNVRVKEKTPFEQVSEIIQGVIEIENELGEKGRLLLRYSGTENLARVMIEGEKQEVIEEQAGRLANVIKNCLG
jgi:phosphoglucosamine mutase